MAAYDKSRIGAVAAEIVRDALAVQDTGDVHALAASIRRKSAGWRKDERLHLATAVAFVAGHLAANLPPETHEHVLSVAETTR
jgi:hypothetical protein